MNMGNIQLVAPKLESGEGGTHRSQAGSDDYAPCIVISALRPRTHGVDGMPPDLLTSNASAEEEQIEASLKWDENHGQLPPPSLQGQQQQGGAGVIVGGDGGVGSLSPPPVGGDSQATAKWQKRHSKMHILSVRFLQWARSITGQIDACRRESDVVVVPAHVVMASQQHRLSAASQEGGRLSSPRGSAAAGQRRKPSDLPDVLEETQQAPSTPPTPSVDDSNNRSRAGTESPAFGSTYV